MSEKEKKYWFPAKRYGWGWGFPSCWQGWVVFLAYIASFFAITMVFNPNNHAVLFSIAVIVSTTILFGICWAKGEPPKWRWGKSDKEEH